MLRECRRVLRPGGRLAVLAIETGAGLSTHQELRAADLGPSQVRADAPLVELARMVGFTTRVVEDVTSAFRVTVTSMSSVLYAHEEKLRDLDGDEAFEEQLAQKAQMLEGIDAGLLVRTLVIADRD